MTIETIKDVLDWSQELHQKLSKLYLDSSDDTDDERLKMLLQYISEHEMKLADAIEKFEKDSSSLTLLNSWFQQYEQAKPISESMKSLAQLNPFNARTVLDFTIDTHQNLIDMYRGLSENAHSGRIKEVFGNLAILEAKDLMRMIHSSERLSDL